MYLGIDVGASYCKAVLIDQDEKVLCSERAPMPSFLPQPPQSKFIFEVDIHEILRVVISVLKNVRAKVKGNVQGIGVAGQMHGILLVDKSNEPVSNFISWQDRRTIKLMRGKSVSYLDYLKSNLSNLRYHTGTDLRPGMLGPILFWLRQNKYPRLEKLKAAFLSDFIVSYLTAGEIVCDSTQAAGSGVYSLTDGCWSKTFLETTHICERILPSVVNPGTECGQISPHISKIIGIRQGIPVYTSIGDYQAALYSCHIDQDTLSINIGTGAQVSLLSNTPIYSDKYETRPFFDNHYLNCISGLPGGRAIKVFENFIGETIKIFLGHTSNCDVLKTLDSLTTDTSEKTGLICYPNFFPDEPSASESGFLNVNADNFSIVALYHALLEGMVREYSKAFMLLKDSSDRRTIKKIILSGGIARKSKTIRKLINIYFGCRPTISPYEEDAAVGAALMARKFQHNKY
jgi:sedoheptulokinase